MQNKWELICFEIEVSGLGVNLMTRFYLMVLKKYTVLSKKYFFSVHTTKCYFLNSNNNHLLDIDKAPYP